MLKHLKIQLFLGFLLPKTNWIFSCGEIGEYGQKTLEMWECDHQQNLLRKEWHNNAGLGKLIK